MKPESLAKNIALAALVLVPPVALKADDSIPVQKQSNELKAQDSLSLLFSMMR
jgi:hypothetical protein